MLYTLRPYQESALADLKSKIRSGLKRLCLVAPTGSGKTVCAAAIIEGAQAKDSKILFLAHRLELINQCSKKLDEIGVEHGIIKANHPRARPWHSVQVASVQTLIRRPKPAASIVIIDEAHRCLAKSYLDILEHYQDAVVIGLTATPWRTDGRGLGELYQDLVVTTGIKQLAADGHLCVPRVFAPTKPNLSGLRTRSGDYAQEDLSDRMDRPKLIGDVVDHWTGLASGRRTVVFGSSVKHSKHLAAAFVAAGVAAEHVDGSMSEVERTGVLSRLASGETNVVCNCDVITEGYDLPELSCAVLARPTKSSVKYRQMVGRIMRPTPTKADCLVLDHAGCTHEHGFVEDDIAYTLSGSARKSEKTVTVKICKACFAVMPLQASRCPECDARQAEFTQPVPRRGPDEEKGTLEPARPQDRPTCKKCGSNNTRVFSTQRMGAFSLGIKCAVCEETSFDTAKQAARDASSEQKRKEYDRLLAIANKRGYKPGWAAYRYQALFGHWPNSSKFHGGSNDEQR